MKKLSYPSNWKQTYLDIYKNDLSTLQFNWDTLRNEHYELKIFPAEVENIILADFNTLLDLFFLYKKLPKNVKDDFEIRKNGKRTAYKPFNYKTFSNQIALYYCSNIASMNISTCFYCDIHPIGKIKKTAAEIHRTFDLDHFFPQNECPLLSLSFMNFVPSCQICNSRVKGKTSFIKFYDLENKSDSVQKQIIKQISPTSNIYDFDNNVSIKVLPKGLSHNISFSNDLLSYQLVFDSSDIYKIPVSAFKLKERYNSVTILSEALYLMDLMKKFPTSKIQEIANILSKSGISITADEIENTLFRKDFDSTYQHNLAKLRSDLIN